MDIELGVGKRIREKRIELGLSQMDLAKRMGYTSKAAICKVERGDDNITADRVTKFAKALGCSEAYIMGWENESESHMEELIERYKEGAIMASVLKDKQLMTEVKKLHFLPPDMKAIIYNQIDYMYSQEVRLGNAPQLNTTGQ